MKKILVIGFVLCMVLILFLSGQSGSQAFELTYQLALPFANLIYDTPDYDQILVVMNVIRLVGRIAAFTVFGGFFAALVNVWGNKLPYKVKNMISVMGIMVFSIFDETHKLFIDGRHCTITEIIVNIICGFAGAGFVMYVIHKKKGVSG